MPSETDVAYLAGVVDGEGCIHILKNRTQCVLTVSNTNREIVEWCAAKFGGHVNGPYRPRKSGWSAAYQWRVTKQSDLWRVLFLIYPYLHVKQEVASEAIAWLASRPRARAFIVAASHEDSDGQGSRAESIHD